MVSRFVRRNPEINDEVGGVPGGRKRALTLRGPVHGTQIVREDLLVLGFTRLQPDHGGLAVQHLRLRFLENLLLVAPPRAFNKMP